MVKVFLVEDEVIIRESIKNSIDWEKEGYHFVGEAGDGELALPMILEEKPDIIITDIRMPFMNGLELSQIVKEKLPDAKIVILSGYDDFSYAKEAIKIGVTEYLLKPVSSATLLEHLADIAERIKKEKEEKQLMQVYQQEMQENEKLIKTKFMGELISGDMSLSQALEKGKRFDIDLSARMFRVFLFKFLQKEHLQQKDPERFLQLYEAVEKCGDGRNGIYVFERGVEGWAFLLTAIEDNIEEKTEDLVHQLAQIAEQYGNLKYFGGIGCIVARVRELRQSFQEADRAFAARFVQESNQIIGIRDLHPIQKDDAFDATSIDAVSQVHKIIEKFLESGSREEIPSFIQALFSELPEEHFQSLMFRQYIIMNIYAIVMAFCKRFETEEREKGQDISAQERNNQRSEELLKQTVTSAKSIQDIQSYISTLLECAIDLRNTISGTRYSDIIRKAQRQIQEDYMSEDISLNSVAAEVCMSPSYFSTIFSKEMGKTFIEYLTEVRMEKAKEYLACSTMKTSEIGYAVGYKDPHYFSFLFKKTQGCTPKEYRISRKG